MGFWTTIPLRLLSSPQWLIIANKKLILPSQHPWFISELFYLPHLKFLQFFFKNLLFPKFSSYLSVLVFNIFLIRTHVPTSKNYEFPWSSFQTICFIYLGDGIFYTDFNILNSRLLCGTPADVNTAYRITNWSNRHFKFDMFKSVWAASLNSSLKNAPLIVFFIPTKS